MSKIETRGVVDVYSMDGCKFCRIAKGKLKQLGIAYKEHDIHQKDTTGISPVIIKRMNECKKKSVPQIYVNKVQIGGYESLVAAIDDGSFFELLVGIGINFILNPSVNNNDNEEDQEQNRIDSAGLTPVVKPAAGIALNTITFEGDFPLTFPPNDLLQVGAELQKYAMKLMDNFASFDGSSIDYDNMLCSNELKAYITLACSIASAPLSSLASLPDHQKISFFSNLYNAFIVHATCVLGAPEDLPAARTDFFKGTTGAIYDICGLLFSPDDIEHGILRANVRHPYQANDNATFLDPGDAREVL